MYNSPMAFLNSNNGSSTLAFGEGEHLILENNEGLKEMQVFIDLNKEDYIFTALSYDLKNGIEKLESKNDDYLNFPKAILWVPKYVIRREKEKVIFLKGENDDFSKKVLNDFLKLESNKDFTPLNADFKARTSVEDYLKNVNLLKEEIQYGNIYEVNYCQEFYAENVDLTNPLETYFKLNHITKAPYSSFFQFNEFSILSGSPESYIQKSGDVIKTSPIKGTRKRGANEEEDEQLKIELFNDKKERAENVMIVDLVRNDLSRIAKKGSVNVDEFLGIHTFETVHQMISTISCEVEEDILFTDILQATFPMGSMTGAPKFSAMNLIEKHEEFQRGIYSGSIGYIAPNGDFDLNVIIRTLIYNQEKQYLACPVGGAITILANAEDEYEECLVKVKGILDQMNA